MGHTIATRRVSRILDHVSGCKAPSPPRSRVSVMDCRGALDSMFQRFDGNKMLFSSQDSICQPGSRHHTHVKENIPSKCSCATSGASSNQNKEEPLFTRNAHMNFTFSDKSDDQLMKQIPSSFSTDALKSAIENSAKIEEQLVCNGKSFSSIPDGLVWSPRIDVAECCSNYVVIVEIPGVNINEIRVVVDHNNITISGKRLMQRQQILMNALSDSNLIYHRKEILQGPYEVNWSLPKDVSRDHVSAEFVDGFLQIVVPKV